MFGLKLVDLTWHAVLFLGAACCSEKNSCRWFTVFLRTHFVCFPSTVFALLKLTSFRSLAYFSYSDSFHLSFPANTLSYFSLSGKFTLSYKTLKIFMEIRIKSNYCSKLYYFVVRKQRIVVFSS